tara:strand:- start:3414 stop:5150 length:1737 start_codon:yes stop_codon:yes gene_type:complete
MFNESQESNIILQGVLLTGIKDIKFDSSVKESSTKLLNNQGIKRKIYGPQKTTCSFSKPYNGKDFIQSLTGVANLSGQFIYKNNAIDFSDAAISSYGLNLDQDGFAEISVTIEVFGDMKPTTNLQLSTASQDFPILDQTPTIAHFDLGNKNSAIKSLNYQASLQPKSSNDIGSIISSNVDFTSPTVHNISADIEMLEQEVEDVTGFAENDKLTKNIEILFAPEANKTSIDRILEIQSGVRDIESSGFDVSHLDFSLGACVYNAFQFNKSSISSQNLNAKAGEVVQLNNQYNAYTNIEKITGSIPVPSTFTTSCADHLQRLEQNLISAKQLPLEILFANQVSFEERGVGETDFNLFLRGIVKVQALIESDFENRQKGIEVLNIVDFNTFFKSETNFENETVEEIDLISLSDLGVPIDQVDFELFATGVTGLVDLTASFEEVDFELFTTGVTGLVDLGKSFEEESFEGFTTGITGLTQISVNDYTNENTFESLSADSTGLNQISAINDFFNQFNFESETVEAITLNELFDDSVFTNENTFELETVGEIALNELLDDSVFTNETSFELETVGEINTNLNNL